MIIHSVLAREGTISSLVHKTGEIKDSVFWRGKFHYSTQVALPPRSRKRKNEREKWERRFISGKIIWLLRRNFFFFTNALCHIQCADVQPLKPILMEVTEQWCSKMTNNLLISLKGSWIYYLAKNEGCSLASTTPLLMINKENSCSVSHHAFLPELCPFTRNETWQLRKAQA